MKKAPICTPWVLEPEKEIPLGEYPRPGLVRKDWMNLNGYWEYSIRPHNTDQPIPEDWDGKILVPFSVETELSGVRRSLDPGEELWYRRPFSVPESWSGRGVLLNFEAVDYYCRCFVNGVFAGEHRGGYLPFSFDITALLKEGGNEISLCVEDPTDSGMQPRGKQVRKPKEIWYEPTSGIWQTVWLEPLDPAGHLSDVNCTWSAEDCRLNISIHSDLSGPEGIRYRINLVNPDGETAILESTENSFEAVISKPQLWTPQTPNLYLLKIKMYRHEIVIDEAESYTALRTVDTVSGKNGRRRFRLNDQLLFIKGLLDQGYWPESGMTAPDDQALIFDIEESKKLGFNCLRKHIKIESRRWYYHADSLGILVIQDMVSGGLNWTNPYVQIAAGLKRKDNSPAAYRKSGRSDQAVRDEFEQTAAATVAHLRNHPSVICWVPFNESWGQYDSVRIGEALAAADPTRLIDFASGWLDQGAGDFYSVHRYVLKLKPQPKKEKRIYMISEYGGYNFHVPGHMWNDEDSFGYKSYSTEEALNTAFSSLIRKQVIPLIDGGLSAVIYTQVSDVEMESNGIFTYDRKRLKFNAELIKQLNTEIDTAFNTAEQIQEGKSE